MGLITLTGGPADGCAILTKLFSPALNRFVVRVLTDKPEALHNFFIEPPAKVLPPEDNTKIALYFPNGSFDQYYSSEALFQEMGSAYIAEIDRANVSRN